MAEFEKGDEFTVHIIYYCGNKSATLATVVPCVTSKKGRRKEEEIRRKKERMEKKEEKKRRTSPQNCRTEKKRCGAKLRECGGFESTGVPRGAASNGTEKKRCGGCVYLDAWRCWDYCITRCRIVLGCTSHFIFFSFAEF